VWEGVASSHNGGQEVLPPEKFGKYMFKIVHDHIKENTVWVMLTDVKIMLTNMDKATWPELNIRG